MAIYWLLKTQETMITENENTHISKLLSLVLRHKPETINIILDEQGWTNVKDLLNQLNKNNYSVTFEMLDYIVRSNNKSRFSFNEDQTKIRANQGHSVDVVLGYEPKEPPDVLYHGTADRFLESIMKTGLQKQARHHVHLSADTQTAIAVGQRYGKPVVLTILAKRMYSAGYKFYRTDNDVWLTEQVPVASELHFFILPANFIFLTYETRHQGIG
jgi:putative RNA 2'-phosphotransferase